MNTIPVASDSFYHPSTEREIIGLINRAKQEGIKIRVHGSGHSVPASVHTGDFKSPPPGEENINILLDEMNAITFDEEKMQVTVQAGCHLGADPRHPDRYPKLEDSLLYKIDQKGWALPITGGIVRQTIGGFVSTGSAGGSLKHAFNQQLVAIRLIDGTGEPRVFVKSDDPADEFYGVALSMGLMGVITSVTIQCVPNFTITGQESTTRYPNCEINLFGSGEGPEDLERPVLPAFFQDSDYCRCMWWPQNGIKKVVVWQAHRIEESAESFKPKPYRDFPVLFGSTRPAQLFIGFFFRFVKSLNPPGPSSWLGRLTNKILKPFYLLVANIFLTNGMKGPQKFWDSWWEGIPMDNRIDFGLLPLEFSEMWFPLDQATEVTRKIRDFFAENDTTVTGTFAVEIYPALADLLWMSPGYKRDSVRFDLIWFEKNKGNPATDFCPQFWKLLKGLRFRLHWGKYLVDDPEYLRSLTPRWDDFMALRERLDPDQLFVTDYWRKYLAIKSKK
jgi:D-arabinono-1,4-lactone oxidase